MCVLVERRFRILQITKIYAESVCVNKRALERVRVRRNCDDVSSEKFGFFFLSEITQPKKRHKKWKKWKNMPPWPILKPEAKKRDVRDERKNKKSLQKNN